MKLNISNIQHFSVGDGDGIRTTVFFKGCNLICPWCHNPENLSFTPSVMHYKTTDTTEVCGKQVTVDDILPELLEDIEFFRQSGGGITLSGGEVMLQAEGAAALAKRLKEQGVAVLIDTAGCVPFQQFERTTPYVDGYLFDFKTADAKKYLDIGGDLEQVEYNISGLLQTDTTLHIRIPLIPNFNTDTASIDAICAHLSKIGIKQVELLPFHRLGSAKYAALGKRYLYEHISPLTPQQIDKIQQQYKKYFIVKTEY